MAPEQAKQHSKQRQNFMLCTQVDLGSGQGSGHPEVQWHVASHPVWVSKWRLQHKPQNSI